MKGELSIRGENRIWYVGRYLVHRDDYFLHLVSGETVEFELDKMSFARVKGTLSIRQACINSLKLFFKIKKTVPYEALIFVHPKVVNEAGVQITDATGNYTYNKENQVLCRLP